MYNTFKPPTIPLILTLTFIIMKTLYKKCRKRLFLDEYPPEIIEYSCFIGLFALIIIGGLRLDVVTSLLGGN